MPIYSDRCYRSRDGLQLYYRDYPGDPNKVPVICLHAVRPPPGAAQVMWSAFAALRNTPTLAIRGELSDLLSVATFDRMRREHPNLQRVTVPNRGHVPQLDEPQSIAALEQFLAELP